MSNIPLSEAKQYIDKCIIFWRKELRKGREEARYYVDAYQSMRISLFGELLESDEDLSSEIKTTTENLQRLITHLIEDV